MVAHPGIVVNPDKKLATWRIAIFSRTRLRGEVDVSFDDVRIYDKVK